jgi:predicted transcriptional regulator
MATMNISLPTPLQTRVTELARAKGQDAQALIIEAIETLLDHEVDREEIAARVARFDETGTAFEHETVLATLRQRAGQAPKT